MAKPPDERGMSECPFLLSSFFQDHPVTPELLARGPQGPWEAEFFPIYEWEGLWFVAGTAEKLNAAEMVLTQNIVFIRAEPEALRMAWQTAQAKTPAMDAPKKSTSPAPTAQILEIQKHLDVLAQSYDHAILFSFENESFVPQYWSKAWHPKTTNFKLSSEVPSPFQLVLKSQHPYHGPVSDDEGTRETFKNLVAEATLPPVQLPENVTLAPIANGEVIVGVVMCMGSKQTYNKAYLNEVTTAAHELQNLVLTVRVAA